MLNHKFNAQDAEWEFRFVSLQSENIKGAYGQDTPAWSSSLTVAVMSLPEDASLTELMTLAKDLLSENGIFGWVIAKTAPKTFNSFRIRQPNESVDIPKDAVLVFTLSFRVELPEALS